MGEITGQNGGPPANADENNWAMAGHLAALAGLIVPFGNILGPLAVLLTKGKESGFVADQAREALNFQITATLALIVSALLVVVLIGLALLPVIALADLVLTILGAVAASKGESYRYPFALRLVN